MGKGQSLVVVSEGLIKRFSLYGLYPVSGSADSAVHNLDSKIDQHEWKTDEHTPKQIIDFKIPVYREVLAILDLSGSATDKIESIFKPPVKFFTSDDGILKQNAEV